MDTETTITLSPIIYTVIGGLVTAILFLYRENKKKDSKIIAITERAIDVISTNTQAHLMNREEMKHNTEATRQSASLMGTVAELIRVVIDRKGA